MISHREQWCRRRILPTSSFALLGGVCWWGWGWGAGGGGGGAGGVLVVGVGGAGGGGGVLVVVVGAGGGVGGLTRKRTQSLQEVGKGRWYHVSSEVLQQFCLN